MVKRGNGLLLVGILSLFVVSVLSFSVSALNATLIDNGDGTASISITDATDDIYSYEINLNTTGSINSVVQDTYFLEGNNGGDVASPTTGESDENKTIYASRLDPNQNGAGGNGTVANISYTGEVSLNSVLFVFNDGSEETINFTSGGDNPGQGNGGGGGKVKVVINPKDVKLRSSLNEIIATVISGEDNTREIVFTNTGLQSYTFDFRVVGMGAKSDISPSTITLAPGQSIGLTLRLSGLKMGVLVGSVVVSVGEVEVKRIPVIANIKSKNFLFDSRISLPYEFKKIVFGEKITAEISLEEVGMGDTKVDVTTNYIIKDMNGRTLYEESETFAVEGEKKFSKEFNTNDLPLGKYVLAMEIIYPGAFATSSTQFSVVTKENFLDNISPTFQVIYVFGIIVLISIIVILWAVLRNSLFVRKYPQFKRLK